MYTNYECKYVPTIYGIIYRNTFNNNNNSDSHFTMINELFTCMTKFVVLSTQ